MDLLLDFPLYDKFFFRDTLEFVTETDVLLFNIFHGKHKKIIFNKKIEKYLLDKAKTDKEKRRITTFITNFGKERMFCSFDSSYKEDNLDEYFISLKNAYQGSFILCVLEKNKKQIAEKIGKELVVLSEGKIQYQPSFHWVKSSLAAFGKLSVRYKDFDNYAEISDFFRSIFNLPIFSDVVVINRYPNFLLGQHKHGFFRHLENKTFSIYTYKLEENAENHDKINRTGMNDFECIVSSNVSFFSTSNPTLIHERTLFFHDFILESDDNFGNILDTRPTWKIDITYDASLSMELKSKLTQFKRFEVTAQDTNGTLVFTEIIT